MPGTPLVSILLPTYNGEKYLAAAIESALAQTCDDFELLVSDDRSDDGTNSIVESYAARDPRIVHWQNEQNMGLFANYNQCLRRAQGQFIKPFAQDDVLEPATLEKMTAAFAGNPGIALVSTGRRWIDSDGAELKVVRPFPDSRRITGREVVLYNLITLTNWVGEPSTVMFPRSAAGEGFDTGLYHLGDIDFWFRVLEHGDYYYLDEVLASFRRHDESTTSSNLSGMYFALDILRVGRKYRGILAEFGESEEHFQARALENIALNVDHLVRLEGLTADQMLDTRKNVGSLHETEAQLAGFRELSFLSMRMITRLIAELDDLRCRTDCERQRLEAELDCLRNSTSWRVTAPLRTLARSIAKQ